MTDRVGNALRAAVVATVQRLAGNEQEVAIDRDVALRSRADERLVEPRNLGIRDVPDLEAVEVSLNDVVAADRQIGIDVLEIARRVAIDELGRWRRRRNESHVPGRLARVEPAGLQPDARIGTARRRRRTGAYLRRYVASEHEGHCEGESCFH